MSGMSFRWLAKELLTPTVPGDVDASLEKIRQSLPAPVLWLLGKVQAGKTSVVAALTGSDRARIGEGYRPCTRTAAMYCFPDEANPLLRFLDTRGLGEANYDPAEDIQQFESQAHLLLVVVKAKDHALGCLTDPLRVIRRRHPDWPVIVLQTCLHECYPGGAMRHAEPYPYGDFPFGPGVPLDLARSLTQQRQALSADGRERFVPIDFTQEGDPYEPRFYGLEALWSSIEEALPAGLGSLLKESAAARAMHDECFRAAQPHVVFYALAAGGGGAVPFPLVDIPLVLAIQGKMLHSVAAIYGQPLTSRAVSEILAALGVGYLMRYGVRQLTKLIPLAGLGSVLSGAFAAASTYGLGMVACGYFRLARQGAAADPKMLRKLYQEGFARARVVLNERLERQGPKP